MCDQFISGVNLDEVLDNVLKGNEYNDNPHLSVTMIKTVDKKFVLLVLNSQDEPMPTGSEARLYKLSCNTLISTLFNEYKHYYF